MMEQNFSVNSISSNPARGSHHRRAHSETFFRFPDLDDILINDVVSELDLDLPQTSASLLPNGPAPTTNRPPAHLRSLSVDADFFDAIRLDAPQPGAEVEPGPRHRRSNSIDGYSSATSCEFDSNGKKGMAADRLAELALIDPKRAKRILANRQSAARSKERKVRYTSELERKVQTLQTEATTLSAQITLLQRDTTGLTTENRELKLKFQALEQQAHLRDALNEALRDEVQRLKIASGQIPAVNGSNRVSPTFHYFGNQQQQQIHMPHSDHNNRSFQDFNRRI